MPTEYESFLGWKTHVGSFDGFNPSWMPLFLFDFQVALVEWAIQKGRAAIFADCGLGKTPMQLVWAENVIRKENKPVLVLTPLAVSYQTLVEAEKFGIEAHRSTDGKVYPGINVTNYERLHYFKPDDFCAVVCDESSILKSFDGVRRGEITQFMRKMRYRLLCTATAAPNDYFELGTSSEALGYLGHMDMLNRFFKNDNNTSAINRFHGKIHQWRFKGHAEIPFWRWVCSWARALRHPSDLGFNNNGFKLPPMKEREYEIQYTKPAPGMLFALPAIGMREQREERRRTLEERCAKVAELTETGKPCLVWCQLNDEGDLLERMIPDSIQIAGKDSDDSKEEKFLAFIKGDARVLVTKPKIGAWGLNLQHCAHVTFFPSDSFEQYYQAVRRCWRFGQKRQVVVDLITTEGGRNVLNNMRRKAIQADKMFSNLVREMNSALSVDRSSIFTKKEEAPPWL